MTDAVVFHIGDQSRPRVICDRCKSVRYCDQHLRSEFPPDAAKRWMQRSCKANGCNGEAVYVAGFLHEGERQ